MAFLEALMNELEVSGVHENLRLYFLLGGKELKNPVRVFVRMHIGG